MKIVGYIIIGLIILILGFFTWFFRFYLVVPELNISEEMSDKQKIEVLDNWFSTLQKQGKFNGVVYLSKEHKTLLSKGYGFTDYRKNKSLTNVSSLRLASVSKQFTAVGILILAESERLNLDDNIQNYIPELDYDDVSIRNLLNQTSGIPDNYLELAERNKSAIRLLSNKKAVELVAKENAEVKFKPNEKFQYSNTNYILLARVIEIISNQSYEDFMKEEVFEPLAMKNTRVWNLLSIDSTFTNKADDFDNQKENVKELKPTFIDGVAGDGAVFSSSNDMHTWDKFWYSNELISQSLLEEAFKKPTLLDGNKSDYGFGWIITDNGMWHNGAWLGANTFIERNTEKKTCTAIFDNSSNLFFDKILNELSKMKKIDNK